MTPDTRMLLAALSAMNQQIPAIAMRIIDDSLSHDKQIEFGNLLIELGVAVHDYARNGVLDPDQEARLCPQEIEQRYGA